MEEVATAVPQLLAPRVDIEVNALVDASRARNRTHLGASPYLLLVHRHMRHSWMSHRAYPLVRDFGRVD